MAALPIQGASAAAMKLCLSAAMGHGPAMTMVSSGSSAGSMDSDVAHGGSHGDSRGDKSKEKSEEGKDKAKDKAKDGAKQSSASQSESVAHGGSHGDGHGDKDKSKGNGKDAKDGEGKGKNDGMSSDLMHPCASSPACGGAAVAADADALAPAQDGSAKVSFASSRFATRTPATLDRPPRA